MKLALVFGRKGNDIKPKILQIRDNLVIDCFNTVDDMISNSRQREYLFDRIVLLSTILCSTASYENEINKVWDYWRTYSRHTNIVCLCNTGKDDELAKYFSELFNSPLCTSMSVSASTISLLGEAATESITSINTKYGIKLNLDVDIEDDSFEIEDNTPKPPTLEEIKAMERKKKEERHEARRKAREERSKNGGGLFGIFKGKKNNNPIPTQEFTNADNYSQGQQVQENISNFNDNDWEDEYDNNLKDAVMSNESENYVDENQMGYEEQSFTPNELPEQFEDEALNYVDNNSNYEDYDENSEFNNVDASPNDGYNNDSSFSSDSYQDSLPPYEIEELPDEFEDEIVESFNDDIIETNQEVTDDSQSEVDIKLGLDDFDFSESVSNTGQESGNELEVQDFAPQESSISTIQEFDDFYKEPEVSNLATDSSNLQTDEFINDYTNGMVNVTDSPVSEVEDDDLGDIILPQSTPKQVASKKPVVHDVKEVDADLGNLGVGAMDESYRTKTEAPKIVERVVEKEKIVEKVVEKEVIRGGVLDNIYSGKASRIIIVTGDRGSGVTSIALDMAMKFAQKTDVLYFDADTELHGLLNYIDYESFRDYEMNQLQGVKLCKSSKAFNNCVMRYSNNFDILGANYGVEVSDTELELTQSVVAEIANNYSVVIVDAPISKLERLTDIILQGNVVLCVEATRRGFMNLICKLEDSTLPLRYKRSIAGKGTLVATKLHPKTDLKKIYKYVNSIVDFDINWLDMPIIGREQEITDKFLAQIVEN